MGGHYLKHQGRVYVEAALTWDMLLHEKKGGFIRMGNIITSLLKETLQKLTGEQFEQRRSNTRRKI